MNADEWKRLDPPLSTEQRGLVELTPPAVDAPEREAILRPVVEQHASHRSEAAGTQRSPPHVERRDQVAPSLSRRPLGLSFQAGVSSGERTLFGDHERSDRQAAGASPSQCAHIVLSERTLAQTSA